MLIFGTRPEAIKMAPVALELNKKGFKTIITSTGQHEEMFFQVLDLFHFQPDYHLSVMTEKPNLYDLTARLMSKLKNVIEKEKPDMVLVQGDTTSTFTGALASFYNKIPISYVESGLRSHSKFQPFPEEVNRRLASAIANYHFVPTKTAKNNLIRENIPVSTIYTVGNTVIDSLFYILKKGQSDFFRKLPENYILVTVHRRENWGKPLEDICKALKIIVVKKNIHVIFSTHKNPIVKNMVNKILAKNERIILTEPLDYKDFVFLMSQAKLIMSDSGGVQEEAPALGKPLFVLREKTERPEGLNSGSVKLIGTNFNRIIKETINILDNIKLLNELSQPKMLYGKGDSSKRIVKIIDSIL